MTTSLESQFRFLEMISAAAVANPFGSERDALDNQIALEFLPKANKKTALLELITEHTFAVLRDVRGSGKRVNDMTERQTTILKDAALFAIFHKYTEDFDSYIRRQNETLGQVLELPFAADIERDLVDFGFGQQSAHYIAIFFQMRRAFFFIAHYVGGESLPVRHLRERLWRTLFSVDLRAYISILFDKMESYSVLLLGETGVGKGQSAAALGRSAYIPFDRKTKTFSANFLDVFISANISEYPETLVESELFGHKKGSFTGALDNHLGLFGQTHPNGVLFLDEIGELDVPLQVKILRVLQERVYFPVGSHERRRFSGRLVAATNADLNRKVDVGLFRADLYHRLASDVISVPSLRERFADDANEKQTLVSTIIQRLLGDSNSAHSASVCRLLDRVVPSDYAWPGNLRELEQVVRRVVLHGDNLRPETLGLLAFGRAQVRHVHAVSGLQWDEMQWTADEVMARYARSAYDVLGSYEKVAQRLNVDWRTAKRWITMSNPGDSNG